MIHVICLYRKMFSYLKFCYLNSLEELNNLQGENILLFEAIIFVALRYKNISLIMKLRNFLQFESLYIKKLTEAAEIQILQVVSAGQFQWFIPATFFIGDRKWNILLIRILKKVKNKLHFNISLFLSLWLTQTQLRFSQESIRVIWKLLILFKL